MIYPTTPWTVVEVTLRLPVPFAIPVARGWARADSITVRRTSDGDAVVVLEGPRLRDDDTPAPRARGIARYGCDDRHDTQTMDMLALALPDEDAETFHQVTRMAWAAWDAAQEALS